MDRTPITSEEVVALLNQHEPRLVVKAFIDIAIGLSGGSKVTMATHTAYGQLTTLRLWYRKVIDKDIKSNDRYITIFSTLINSIIEEMTKANMTPITRLDMVNYLADLY